MKPPTDAIAVLCLLLALSQTSQETNNSLNVMKPTEGGHLYCRNDSTCPTWFICNEQNSCQCGDEHNYAVVCDSRHKQSSVLDCHCVTYDKETGSTYLGLCFYNCENVNPNEERDPIYNKLPQKPEDLLKKSACTHFHRTGLLCGDCEEGYSPLVLSYNLRCVRCPDGHKNWWKFILVGFVPLTFFYFFVIFFNINVTSSRLYGVVWFSQAVSMPAFVRYLKSGVSYGSPHLSLAINTILVFYSFWNLDIFRSVIPDICLDVSTLQALSLDYLVALYPFVLILLSYIFIELHGRQFALVVTIWKPFRKVLSVFRRSWDIRTSVIDSFATFFMLSYVKVLNVTTDLLIPTTIYQLGTNKIQFGLYYSPTVRYFGDEHLPYAITAIIILTLFVSIPTMIFILYPFQFFQKFLSFFPLNWHFLHAFIDSFQGCYKDGTESGMFDCRWFSTFIHLTRLLLYIIFGTTLSMIFFVYGLVAFLILSIAAINIQPFKKVASRYPSTDTVFYVLSGLVFIAAIAKDVATTGTFFSIMFTIIFAFLTAFIPIVYIASLIFFWMISRMRQIRRRF